MGSQNTIEIQVSTSDLMRQAQTMRTRVAAIQKRFRTIEDRINDSAYYWIGDAGDTHRQAFFESKEGIESALESFADIAQMLEEIAGEYDAAETKQVSHSSTLKTDVII